ncbi:Hypothetical predicted protein [Pelobates cultripes]|uniref:Uncharacterized protein n=1 Tax=Pelobates cultripes TaxID=61616 RepID=A0AAD1W5V0_PELCU|nr:Hypothetical predicted protein [Pelobates cultripes]
MAATTTKAFHEARIEKAFECFRSQFWATMGQKAEREAAKSSVLTNPRRALNPQPAVHGHDIAPTARRRRRKKRRVPNSRRLSAAGIRSSPKPHHDRLQGSTLRPAQDLSRAGGQKGTIRKHRIATLCPTLPSCVTDPHSRRHVPVNGTLGLYELLVCAVNLPITGIG